MSISVQTPHSTVSVPYISTGSNAMFGKTAANRATERLRSRSSSWAVAPANARSGDGFSTGGGGATNRNGHWPGHSSPRTTCTPMADSRPTRPMSPIPQQPTGSIPPTRFLPTAATSRRWPNWVRCPAASPTRPRRPETVASARSSNPADSTRSNTRAFTAVPRLSFHWVPDPTFWSFRPTHSSTISK